MDDIKLHKYLTNDGNSGDISCLIPNKMSPNKRLILENTQIHVKFIKEHFLSLGLSQLIPYASTILPK